MSENAVLDEGTSGSSLMTYALYFFASAFAPSSSAANVGALLLRRHYYFVTFGQDAPETKPRSLVADMERLPQTIDAALEGRQLQPILLGTH